MGTVTDNKFPSYLSMADLAKFNVVLSDIIEVLIAGKLQEHSVQTLNNLKDAKRYPETLNLVETFAQSTAFIDHDAMCDLLGKAWSTYGDMLNVERKQLKKKLTAIKEDKKAEPEQVSKIEGQMEDFCGRRANCIYNIERLKAMNLFKFEDFKDKDLPAIIKLYDEEKNIRAMA